MKKHWYIKGREVCLHPGFYDDHAERGLPTPKITRFRGTSYWISLDDPATAELLDDAKHYANPNAIDDIGADLRRWAINTRNRLLSAFANAKHENTNPS